MRHIAFIFIVLALTNCKKYGHGTVTGTVYETGSNNPVPNATVSIEDSNSGLHPFSSSNANNKKGIIATTTSDSEGKYVLYFHKKIGHHYYIRCEKENFDVFTAFEISQKKIDHDIYLDPFAYLKLHVIKTSTNSNYIYVTINKNQSEYPYSSPLSFDTILPKIYKIKGNNSSEITWDIYNSNYVSTDNGSVYANKGDTIIFTINNN